MADRRHRRKTHEIRGGNGKYQLRNGLSILPSLFTIGNIFCAYYSVMSTLNLKYDQAAIAIGVGYILDGLDGRVARLTGTSTGIRSATGFARRRPDVRNRARHPGVLLGH